MFLNLALAGGLLAAIAPLAIHIAHRRKVVPVEWGAMRFLVQMLRQQRRQLLIEHWLLLSLRMGVLACLALALMRPALRPSEPPEGKLIVRSGRVAAVILIDDSASTGAGRARPAMTGMRELALAYLDTLAEGDEVSLIRLSELNEPRAAPLYDLAAARERIAACRPTGVASDVPALLEAGRSQLARHLNPAAELVLVTDGLADGWRLDDRPRWQELGEAWRNPAEIRRPRLIVLAPPPPPEAGNAAVVDLTADRALIPAGAAVRLRVGLRASAALTVRNWKLRLRVDGRTVAEDPVELAAGGRRELLFPQTFAELGSHLVEAELVGGGDVFAADNRRACALEAQARIPVLLVEGVTGPGVAGDLGLVNLALDPEGDGEGLFRPKRITAAELARQDLSPYRVIVMGNIPALEPAALAAVERFVAAGGGVLVGGGPALDAAAVNRFWSRDGDGFLPVSLGELVSPATGVVPSAQVYSGHPALAAFAADTGGAWAGWRLKHYFKFESGGRRSAEVQNLVSLNTGEPLVVERACGQGRAILIATSLDSAWSNLPALAAYVPLMRGLSGYLASEIMPPRNLRPGTPLRHRGGAQARLFDAMNHELPLAPGVWEGLTVWASAPLRECGGYRIEAGGLARPVHYAVQLAAEESRLEPLTVAERDRVLADFSPAVFSRPGDLQARLAAGGRRAVEVWRWVLAAAIGLLFAESLAARALGARNRED